MCAVRIFVACVAQARLCRHGEGELQQGLGRAGLSFFVADIVFAAVVLPR